MAKKKHPGGRPTNFKPEYCDMVIEIVGKKGKTIGLFAKEIGVNPKVVFGWAKKNEEFCNALDHARQLAKTFWIEKGADAIDSPRPFREGLYQWLMAVRFNIRAKQEVQATNTNLNHNSEVNPEELEALTQKLMQAAKDAAEFA